MTTRTGLLVTTAVSALIISMSLGTTAKAADQMVVKAPPLIGWWSEGYIEGGGRFFVQKTGGGTGGNWQFPAGPYSSLGKFYEYRDLRPGPFGEIFLAGGTRDGLYQYGFLAKNIGYRDQRYVLDWSQAGTQYLTLGFDQTPHIYNDNATTLFQGAGSNTLTINPAVATALNGFLGVPAGSGSNTVNATNAANIANKIEGNLNSFTLGFQRYTGTVDYRWTPNDNTDVKVDYNITRREGTQPMGSLTYNSVERGGRIVMELPRPIHDETHNANGTVEYSGVTPWGKKFNVMASYGISAYRNDSDSFTFQNPFVTTNGAVTPVNNLMSLAPSNTANMFRVIGALDLPMKSRWQGAVSYTVGQQNAALLPFTINPDVGALPTLTGSASGFESKSLLVNNVLTTKWTPELAQTSRYRYYNYDASHDPVTMSTLLLADSSNTVDFDDGISSRGVHYTKQNASSEFVYRPANVRWLTVGAGAGWEQWNRHWRGDDDGTPDVRVTNEFSGKAFVSAKPWDWTQLRASYIHAERRFDGDYQQTIGGNDESCSGPPSGTNCSNFRAYDLANRNRDKLNVALDLYAPNDVVITPFGGFRFDDYSGGMILDQNGGGLVRDNSWNAGLEASWKISRDAMLFGSYTHEDGRKELWIPFTSHSISASKNIPWRSDTTDKIDTFMVGGNFVAVPDKLDFRVSYTLMHATGAIGGAPTNPPASFPDQSTTLNRLDVQARYKVDPSLTRQAGFKGETYVKLRYLWENNRVTDWAAVNWNYMYLFNGDTANNKSIYLGWNNPNYNVQLLALSLGFKW